MKCQELEIKERKAWREDEGMLSHIPFTLTYVNTPVTCMLYFDNNRVETWSLSQRDEYTEKDRGGRGGWGTMSFSIQNLLQL